MILVPLTNSAIRDTVTSTATTKVTSVNILVTYSLVFSMLSCEVSNFLLVSYYNKEDRGEQAKEARNIITYPKVISVLVLLVILLTLTFIHNTTTTTTTTTTIITITNTLITLSVRGTSIC